MGNNKSKPMDVNKPKRPCITPKSIDDFFAECTSEAGHTTYEDFFNEVSVKENSTEQTEPSSRSPREVSQEETSETLSSQDDTEVHDNSGNNADEESTAPRQFGPGMRQPNSFGQSAGSNLAFQAAYQAVNDRLQLLAMQARDKLAGIIEQARDKLADAIEQVKKLGLMGVARVVGRWMKEHPWETAAIIVFIVVMASTPAILGAMGFTSAGIAAGSAAAALQSGIGSVVAGSVFAVCQSAMMGGYGAFIFFVAPTVTAAGIAVTGRIWQWWRARQTGNVQGTDTDTTDTTDTDATEPLLLDLGADTDTADTTAVEPPTPSSGPMASVRDVTAAVGQAATMGALAATAIVVYKYRKWQRSRRT